MDDIEAQKRLSDRELTIFNAELDRSRRSTPIAYALWFFLGSLGGHNFYISKIVWGVVYMLLFGTGWVFLISGLIAAGASSGPDAGAAGAGLAIFGWLALGLLGFLLLWDLVTLPRQIRKREERLRHDLLAKLDTRADEAEQGAV